MSQQNDEFISFEKALRDLKMQSEELKKLVSEGEIRAFRDGDSMKFRREDLDSLKRTGGDEEEELIFAESLEDDAGMQTEELSDEDTLLADDDEFEEEPAAGVRPGVARPSTSRVRAALEEEEETKEPGWVIAAALISSVLLLYGFMVAYKVAMETPPSGLTGMWAPKIQ